MLSAIEINGEWYHAIAEDYDEEKGTYRKLTPIYEEDGSLIPLSICLCYAHAPSECMCACDSWGSWYDYYEDDYMGDVFDDC